MLTTISKNLKMDAPRTFIFLFISFIIMMFYGLFLYTTTDNIIIFVLYMPVFIYIFYNLKAIKLYREFKIIWNNSTSKIEFEKDYASYVTHDDFIKLRKVSVFLLGLSVIDLILLISTALI